MRKSSIQPKNPKSWHRSFKFKDLAKYKTPKEAQRDLSVKISKDLPDTQISQNNLISQNTFKIKNFHKPALSESMSQSTNQDPLPTLKILDWAEEEITKINKKATAYFKQETVGEDRGPSAFAFDKKVVNEIKSKSQKFWRDSVYNIMDLAWIFGFDLG